MDYSTTGELKIVRDRQQTFTVSPNWSFSHSLISQIVDNVIQETVPSNRVTHIHLRNNFYSITSYFGLLHSNQLYFFLFIWTIFWIFFCLFFHFTSHFNQCAISFPSKNILTACRASYIFPWTICPKPSKHTHHRQRHRQHRRPHRSCRRAAASPFSVWKMPKIWPNHRRSLWITSNRGRVQMPSKMGIWPNRKYNANRSFGLNIWRAGSFVCEINHIRPRFGFTCHRIYQFHFEFGTTKYVQYI